MTMFFNSLNKQDHIERPKFFVDRELFPQTKDVITTRAIPVGIEIVEGDYKTASIDSSYFGAIVQYPNDKGSIEDYRSFINTVHGAGALIAMATDLLALTLLTPPGELGADVAVGSAQRFGVPLGYGGPHAAFFSAKDDFKRSIPGRIIGVSIDAQGSRALRMALQTREQHIKREKATSNICTAQALLANMASLYAVFHGAEGLRNIAKRVALLTQTVAGAIEERGFELVSGSFFDTIVVKTSERSLYFVIDQQRALRFPVGVGRTGKTWTGLAQVEGKFVKPAWQAPPELGGGPVIPGGAANNPMGAAVLGLNRGNYAIHGTNDPSSIGGYVSHGCIRMHNADILDLYRRVPLGANVHVTN